MFMSLIFQLSAVDDVLNDLYCYGGEYAATSGNPWNKIHLKRVLRIYLECTATFVCHVFFAIQMSHLVLHFYSYTAKSLI